MTRDRTAEWHRNDTALSRVTHDRGGDRTHDLRIKRSPADSDQSRKQPSLLHLHGRAEQALSPKAHPKARASGTEMTPRAQAAAKPRRAGFPRAQAAPAEAFRAIRPQHGARYRVVTDDDRVVELVRYDARARAFTVLHRGRGAAPRQVPLARVVLVAKRALARCGGEVFARLRTWDDEPGGAA